MENKESKIISNWKILDVKNEMEYSLRPEFLRQHCSWGAVGMEVDQSMCGSILTLPPLLEKKEGKKLPLNSVTAS